LTARAFAGLRQAMHMPMRTLSWSRETEGLLRQYLLGQLPEDAQELLERRLMTSTDFEETGQFGPSGPRLRLRHRQNSSEWAL